MLLSASSGSEIVYFRDNNLSLPQFRPGCKDSKNGSELFSDSKRMRIILFWRQDFGEKINILWYMNSII